MNFDEKIRTCRQAAIDAKAVSFLWLPGPPDRFALWPHGHGWKSFCPALQRAFVYHGNLLVRACVETGKSPDWFDGDGSPFPDPPAGLPLAVLGTSGSKCTIYYAFRRDDDPAFGGMAIDDLPLGHYDPHLGAEAGKVVRKIFVLPLAEETRGS